MKPRVAIVLFLSMLVAASLACEVPDEWIEAARHLPTLTPTPAPLTLYVALDGAFSNDCLTPATACPTGYAALSKATPGSTINFAAGTFDLGGSSFSPRFDLTLAGAGVDRTTLVNSDGGDVIQFAYRARISVHDLTVAGASGMNRKAIEARAHVQLTLENCRVRDNYYGLYMWASSLATIRNCTFQGNSYAVNALGGELHLSNSTFTTNQIALANAGTATVGNTTFDANGTFDAASSAASPTITNSGAGTLAVTGGSLSNSRGFGLIVDGGTVTLDGIDVHHSTGMAIWQTQGATTIRSSLIHDNAGYGIAIGGRSGVADIGSVQVFQTAIVRNRFSGVRMDGGEVTLQNVTVSGNGATNSGGGGIWMEGGGTLLLLDSTVTANTGIGIDAPSSLPTTITARRSVVAVNTAQECLFSSTVTGSWTANPYMCNETYTAAALGLGALTTDSGTLVHPLQAGSPLIDAGGPPASCPANDQRELHRPVGSTCDVGAYEFGIASAAIVIATPGTGTPGIIEILKDTPTPGSIIFLLNKNANCRHGPGAVYPVLTSLLAGQSAQVIGRNQDASWLYANIPGDFHCWMLASSGTPDGDVMQAPVQPAPPTPTPTITPKPNGGGGPVDSDGDGYKSDKDCNDKNAKIHPGASETAKDGVDSNCNGKDDS